MTYQLQRGGVSIEVEKEASHFTAQLPTAEALRQMAQHEEVQEVKPVFRDVFKIKTSPGDLDDLMSATREAGFVSHHAYQPAGDDASRYYLTDRLVAFLKPHLKSEAVHQVCKRFGLELLKQFDQAGNKRTYLLRVKDEAGKNPLKVAREMLDDPRVLTVEPNLVNRFQPAYEPADKLFERQWHLKSSEGLELAATAGVEAPKAWDVTRGKRRVVVAILDDGFDLSHPDLGGEGKIKFPKDFVDGDDKPFPAGKDFHGTPVAGVAIGEDNGEGIVGIAPGCAFMPVRVPFNVDDQAMWEIFNYAGRHADVISCSWNPVPVYAPLPLLLDKKFTELFEKGGRSGKGCVICFAAGNFNAPVYQPGNANFRWRHSSTGEVKVTKGSILNGMAAHPSVVAVAASTSQNRHAAYSNWGREISLCAPSNNFHPLEPEQRLPGRGIWTTDNHRHGEGYSSGRHTGAFGGTSAATPLVAGVAALVRSANEALTASQVRQVLLETADKITDTAADIILGHKKGAYDERGHSEWFGFGKVNAHRAVLRAKELLPPLPFGTGVFIAGALVNPTGSDVWRESVMLFNATSQPVSLEGWSLSDGSQMRQVLEARVIKPKKLLSVSIRDLLLGNFGGRILLADAFGRKVDEVAYAMEEAGEEGKVVKFVGG